MRTPKPKHKRVVYKPAGNKTIVSHKTDTNKNCRGSRVYVYRLHNACVSFRCGFLSRWAEASKSINKL